MYYGTILRLTLCPTLARTILRAAGFTFSVNPAVANCL